LVLCILIPIKYAVAAKVKNQEAIYEGEVPRFIAVLPAEGSGKWDDRDDIRLAIHNALGASTFDLLKPSEVNRSLSLFDTLENINISAIPVQQLCKSLRVDGLVFTTVNKFEKVYAAAYAHYKIGIESQLYDCKQAKQIWQFKQEKTEREGGISANPLGILATAITSSRVLTSAVRLQLSDSLARKFARKVPKPTALIPKQAPPFIEATLTNSTDGPFRAGDEIRVLLRAEPGLEVKFRFGHQVDQWHAMHAETSEAISEGTSDGINKKTTTVSLYSSRYVVKMHDDVAQTGIVLHLQKKHQAGIEWPVPGRLTIITQAPLAVQKLTGIHESDQVTLHWQKQDKQNQLRYQVSRADEEEGRYIILGNTELNRYSDTTLSHGKTYIYRVEAQDKAGNISISSAVRLVTERFGPTNLNNDIRNDTLLKAIGSPYRIKSKITLIQSAKLEIEAGALIEFAPGAALIAHGQITALGTAQAPIIFRGDDWQIRHEFSLDNRHQYQHVHWYGNEGETSDKKASRIIIRNSHVNIEHCYANNIQFHSINATTALKHCLLEKSPLALTSENSTLIMQDSYLVSNEHALDILFQLKLNQDKAHLASNTHVQLARLSFDSNNIHIRSNDKLTLKEVSFPSDDFLSITPKLQGPIDVDWSSLANKNNLKKKWLIKQWPQVAEAIRTRAWPLAHSRAKTINKQLGNAETQEIIETLYLIQNPSAQIPKLKNSSLLEGFSLLRQQGARPDLLWLPQSDIGTQSSTNTKKTNNEQLRRAYFLQYHRQAFNQNILDYNTVDLDDSIVVKKPIYWGEDGQAGLLLLVNRNKLDAALRRSGFIRRQPLISDLELIRPSHKSLCDTPAPWQFGERLLNKHDTLKSTDCFALRLRILARQQLYVLAQNKHGHWERLVPNNCKTSGLLTHRVSKAQTLTIPRNNNHQNSVATMKHWPYQNYVAIAVDEANDHPWLEDILAQIGSPCENNASPPLSLASLTQALRIIDIKSGGNIQWLNTSIKLSSD